MAFLAILISISALSAEAPPDILPGMKFDRRFYLQEKLPVEPAVARALQLGERNLAWLATINSRRANDKISAYNKNAPHSQPIDSPKYYSPRTIELEYQQIERHLPLEFKRVLLDGTPPPSTYPTTASEYRYWLEKIDLLYSTAARWQTLLPWHSYYRDEAPHRDLRGYYYLSRVPDLASKLQKFSELSKNEQVQLKSWLVGLCFNDPRLTRLECQSQIERFAKSGRLLNLYSIYEPIGRQLYQNQFTITLGRPEFRWKGPELRAPFRETNVLEAMGLFKRIEVAWRSGAQAVRLMFSANAAVHVEFVAGQNPMVNGLAGNTITLDANVPIMDDGNQVVIAHEFGHVLGFPDCYVEFYDVELAAMVVYQLDVKNIMCSREGRVLPLHFAELHNVYAGTR
jgi:hypothetical protein